MTGGDVGAGSAPPSRSTSQTTRGLSPGLLVALGVAGLLIVTIAVWALLGGDDETESGAASGAESSTQSSTASDGITPFAPTTTATSSATTPVAPAPAPVPTPPPTSSQPEPTTEPLDGTIPWCDLDDLPATMLPVVEAVWDDGPFDHPGHDGGRFGNYEGYLPDEYLGYYREYTVDTPGIDHRGARRVVTGGDVDDDPDVWYYTADHYQTFCEFDPDEVLEQ